MHSFRQIFIAKQISKNCNTSLENARFIVTIEENEFFDQFNNQLNSNYKLNLFL